MTIYFSCTFNFGKISSSKEGITPPKNMKQTFLQIFTSTQYDLQNYKVSSNFVEKFQRSYVDKQLQQNFFF